MWMLLFLFLFEGENRTVLETSGILEYFPGSKMSVNRDGSLMLATPQSLHHWDQNGRLIQRIDGPSSQQPFRFIITFHYDERKKIYWVVDQESYFFNQDAQLIGKGEQVLEEGKKPMFIRDLMKVGSRVFALDGGKQDTWASELPKVIQSVNYEIEADKVQIYRRGQMFGRLTEIQREYSFNFKRHWLVQDGFSTRFFLINELSSSFRHYQAGSGGILEGLNPVEIQPTEVFMPQWEEAPSQANNREAVTPDRIHTFSQITGFYRCGNNLVVGYTIPTGDPGKQKLGLQLMSKDGVVRGDAHITHGMFMGVYKNIAYVLQSNAEQKSYWIVKVVLHGNS